MATTIALSSPPEQELIRRAILVRPLGQMAELGPTIASLTSAAFFITGPVILADGGQTPT